MHLITFTLAQLPLSTQPEYGRALLSCVDEGSFAKGV